MDTELIKAVVAGMDEALAPSAYTLQKIYNLDLDVSLFGGKAEARSDERRALIDSLETSLSVAGEQTCVYLELCGLKETRAEFVIKWAKLKSSPVDVALQPTEDEMDQDCPAFDFLHRVMRTFNAMLSDESTLHSRTQELVLQDLLIYVLESTPQILKNYAITPKREADIKKAMSRHLKTVFKDYTTDLTISNSILSFKPDGGVQSLRSAVEFKYCASKNGIKMAIHGLREDFSGYSGSRDWTTFYSVVYQSKAFVNKMQFESALGSSSMPSNWKLILLTGD